MAKIVALHFKNTDVECLRPPSDSVDMNLFNNMIDFWQQDQIHQTDRSGYADDVSLHSFSEVVVAMPQLGPEG